MRKLLLFCLILGISCLGYSQYAKPPIPKSLLNVAVKRAAVIKDNGNVNLLVKPNAGHKSITSVDENEIGGTVYDLQSNLCTPYGRLHYYADGTMAAVWTKGSGTYTDRGTGYNYFDGNNWGPEPTVRIENTKTGWPSVAPLGVNGEIVTAHHNTAGLVVCKRATKGAGAWTQTILPGPAGAVDISWPRLVTTGVTHDTVHIIASTYSAYQGLNLALLYYRSIDGGVSWDKQHEILPGMSSVEYSGFSGDSYSWVEPQGDKLALLVCDNQDDFFVMKSDDAGETWSKTIIWEHPYPHWNGTSATDTFYCPDGSAHGAFDNNGLLHVVFGVNRAMADGSAASWYPWVDGIAYWNENLPTWTGGTQHEQEYCLDPDLLFTQGSLIGWMQDINGNGQLDLVGNATSNLGLYYVSPSSMPQLAVDQNNMLYMLYSGITETFDNGSQQYRHIWGRGSSDGGQTWGVFKDFTGDVLHAYDECVFPVIASKTDDNVHSIYQADNEPGMALRGDADPPGDNFIRHLHVSKSEFELASGNFTIGITITYPKPTPVPLNDIQVDLKDNGGNVIQTGTSINGQLEFTDVPEGNYTLAPTTTKPWGGVTAGDVLLYKKHIAGISLLDGIFLASGDVNASGTLTASDVLLIKKRIASIINSFSVGDWIFDNLPLNVTTNMSVDLHGLIYGDANASYNPTAKGNNSIAKNPSSPATFTIQSVTTQPGTVTVPVMANAVQDMGALQFTINYDSNKLKFSGVDNWSEGIQDVTVNSKIPGQLTFVWAADVAGVSIANGKLCDLHFTTLTNETSIISWSDSPTLREYTDWNGNAYEASYIDGMTDVTTSIAETNNASLSIYPNPNNGSFNLILNNKVQSMDVRVYNAMGSLVFQKLFANINNSLEINLSDLPKGIYLLNANGKDVNFVKQLVIK